MVRRSETLGTLGRVTAAKEAKEAAHKTMNCVQIVDTNADEFDFPELG